MHHQFLDGLTQVDNYHGGILFVLSDKEPAVGRIHCLQNPLNANICLLVSSVHQQRQLLKRKVNA